MDDRHIFLEALNRPAPEARSAYLDEACGDDAELRQRVELLLAAHEDAGSFLEKTPEELLATIGRVTETDLDAWQELLTPSDKDDCLGMLGRYEILELIGRGGAGVVLSARDPQLNRVVAVKMLRPELAMNAVSIRRFLREAQSAAAVSHDHVISIHAIDELGERPLIVMELIAGQSLQEKIDREGPLDVKSILRIGMQTAAGLAAAHKQGLIHRDIKPSNILLENGVERVKLTDFGLARAVDDIGMTRTGQITGTPQYMSPEQAQGQRIDHRTDLFSLGCVLYAMCTGRAPFRADSAVAVMHRVVHEPPKPVREINEDIPEWLCRIVAKLMEKDPERRFASASEVEDLLGRHLAHLQQPASVPLPEPVEQSSTRQVEQLDQAFKFAARVTLGVGLTCLAFAVWTFLAFAFDWFRHWEQSFVGLLLAGGAMSFVVGLLAMNAHWDILRRTRYRWVYGAVCASLIPWNPFLLLALPWTLKVLDVLNSPSVLRAFGIPPAHEPSGETLVDNQVSAADRQSLDRSLHRSRVALACLIAVLIGYGASELSGTTHGVIRTIDNLQGKGRIELTSIAGNVEVRGPGSPSLETYILREGLGSPEQTSTFSAALYPGNYEVQFYSDDRMKGEVKEIEILRGRLVRVYTPKDIERVDLAQAGPVRTYSGSKFDFRQFDPLLGSMILLSAVALALLISTRYRSSLWDSHFAGDSRDLSSPAGTAPTEEMFRPHRRTFRSRPFRTAILAAIALFAILEIFSVTHVYDSIARAVNGQGTLDVSDPNSTGADRVTGIPKGTDGEELPDEGSSADTDAIPQQPFWVWKPRGDISPILSIDASDDQRWVATGHRGGEMFLWWAHANGDTRYGFPEKNVVNHVYDVEFSPDDRMIAWVQSNGRLRLRKASKTQTTSIDKFPTLDDSFRSLAWAPDNKTILVGGQGKIYVWNIDRQDKPLATVEVPGNSRVLDIAWSPHANEFATALADGNIILWNAQDVTPTVKSILHEDHGKQRAHSGEAYAVAYSPTERLLLSCGDDGYVRAWELDQPDLPIWTQNYVNGKALRDVQISPDGRSFAAVGDDRQLHLTDTQTLKSLLESDLQGSAIHDAEITSVCFKANGPLLTAGADGTIKWWRYYRPNPTADSPKPSDWKQLLSQAASIPLDEWNTLAGDIKGPHTAAVRGEPLSLVLLKLNPFEAAKENAKVRRDFWYLTETIPKPNEIGNAISISRNKGYVSFLQPEYITNVAVDQNGESAAGHAGFMVPKLYSGRVEFKARREDGDWNITEFTLPNYVITLRPDENGQWQRVELSTLPPGSATDVTVTIGKDGGLSIQSSRVDWADLDRALLDIKQPTGKNRVLLQVHPDVPYTTVIEVIDKLKQHGYQKYMFQAVEPGSSTNEPDSVEAHSKE